MKVISRFPADVLIVSFTKSCSPELENGMTMSRIVENNNVFISDLLAP
jgi:hypothetical protein